MKKVSLPFLALFLLSSALISTASAEESYTRASHAMQKQGKVHFQQKADEEIAAQDSYEEEMIHPADIEPAAGGFEPEDMDKPSNLSEQMRLPRKH